MEFLFNWNAQMSKLFAKLVHLSPSLTLRRPWGVQLEPPGQVMILGWQCPTCPVFCLSNTLKRFSITTSALHLHNKFSERDHNSIKYLGKSCDTSWVIWSLLILSSGKSILKEFQRDITSSSVNWWGWKLALKNNHSSRPLTLWGFSSLLSSSSFLFFFPLEFSSGLKSAMSDIKFLKGHNKRKLHLCQT